MWGATSRLPVAAAIAIALGGCGGEESEATGGGSFAERADAACARFNPRIYDVMVEGVAGSHVSRKRLAGFWARYPEEQQRLLGVLRELDPPAGAAQAYLDGLERNLGGYRSVQDALESGSAEALSIRTMNSELEARRLAARAGLRRCSPSEHMRPTAYAAFLVERAGS